MNAAPPRLLEKLIGCLIPPARREHVVGDLHERYENTWLYLRDAASAVPMVILSRIRRTADPQLLLMEAFGLYIAFVGAAWWIDRGSFLFEPYGLLRLAIPAAIGLLAFVLVDAYAQPSKRSTLKPMLQTAAGLAFAFLSQMTLWLTGGEFAVPWNIMLYGGGASLILVSALRMFFAAPDIRPRGGA